MLNWHLSDNFYRTIEDIFKDIIIGGFILPIILVQRHYAAYKQPPFWFIDLGLHTVSTSVQY